MNSSVEIISDQAASYIDEKSNFMLIGSTRGQDIPAKQIIDSSNERILARIHADFCEGVETAKNRLKSLTKQHSFLNDCLENMRQQISQTPELLTFDTLSENSNPHERKVLRNEKSVYIFALVLIALFEFWSMYNYIRIGGHADDGNGNHSIGINFGMAVLSLLPMLVAILAYKRRPLKVNHFVAPILLAIWAACLSAVLISVGDLEGSVVETLQEGNEALESLGAAINMLLPMSQILICFLVSHHIIHRLYVSTYKYSFESTADNPKFHGQLRVMEDYQRKIDPLTELISIEQSKLDHVEHLKTEALKLNEISIYRCFLRLRNAELGSEMTKAALDQNIDQLKEYNKILSLALGAPSVDYTQYNKAFKSKHLDS